MEAKSKLTELYKKLFPYWPGFNEPSAKQVVHCFGRRHGRNTVAAFRFLGHTMDNPGYWFTVYSPQPGDFKDDRRVLELMADIVTKLKIEDFHFKLTSREVCYKPRRGRNDSGSM